MKVATWNVNSIRTRLVHLSDWLTATGVDAICLQETKVTDELFPAQAIADLGYHVTFYGQKSYNGVAIISKRPLTEVSLGFGGILGDVGDLDEQKRVISGKLDGVRLVGLYVPNGSSLTSDKYAYKLRWLETLQAYLHHLLQTEEGQLLVCGDFNIALADIDIHNPKGREKEVMATDAEREALTKAVLDLGLQDVFRKFTPEPEHYSWWDYRAASFRRNAGWRIDHIYLTPDLYDKAERCWIDKAPRMLEQPSDHTPVVVEF